jgi:hypothetical protein
MRFIDPNDSTTEGRGDVSLELAGADATLLVNKIAN